MAVPKRKMSKSRKRARQSTHKRSVTVASACPKCGGNRLPHRVCPACGTYNGRQVLIISTDE